MKRQLIGYTLAVITITIWSSTFVITKLLLEHITEVQILVTRTIVAVLFLLLIYPKIKKVQSLKTELLFFVSGVALAMYFIFENTSVNLTFPSNVGLLVATSPLFTAIIISFLEKKQYFNRYTSTGFILAYLGVALVVFGDSGIEGFEPIGDLLAVLAALMFAVYTVVLSSVTEQFHLIEKTRKVFFYTAITLVIYGVLFSHPIIWDTVQPSIVVGVLFLAIVASSLAFIFWNKSIEMIGTFKTSLFIYLIPVVTMILSFMIIDDPITLYKSIGAIMIIGGLYLSERKSAK